MSFDAGPWLVLALIVGGMLALDLLVLHRDAKPVPFRQAAAWSAVWIGLALGFGVFVAATRGAQSGGEYLAGYLIELSLSVDNVFVFALIFAAFAVPAAYQHRLLFWGILGAIVFRAVFIAAGAAVLAAAHWVIYLLGVLLIVTGVRLARSRGHAVDPSRNLVLRLFRRLVPTTGDYRGSAFFVIEGGRRLATPLLAALVAVETTDIMFALDSIPAVFAVTIDPFIVFSSNLFAILGLRSLYFLLAGLLDRFVYLKAGLAALLVFAGAKILVSAVAEVPIALSLTAIVLILGTSIVASLAATQPGRAEVRARVLGATRSWGPILRVALGVTLGLAALGVMGIAAAVRDGGQRVHHRSDGAVGGIDATWLVLDVALLLVAGGVVLAGAGLLRRAHTRFVRPWLAMGAALLLVLGLLMSLD
jgi:tellurite resistance protein TerC